jgi:SpoIID/LytB domain protein
VYDREDFSLAFGEKLEEVKSILLNKKGDCFHYQEIEVITGARKSLKGDLPIRNYLDHLRSSAFKLETKFSGSGKLSMLIFWGAGFGHGAGMCQDGAVSMAEAGYDWRQIIRHYFPNTRIKKLY